MSYPSELCPICGEWIWTGRLGEHMEDFHDMCYAHDEQLILIEGIKDCPKCREEYP